MRGGGARQLEVTQDLVVFGFLLLLDDLRETIPFEYLNFKRKF